MLFLVYSSCGASATDEVDPPSPNEDTAAPPLVVIPAYQTITAAPQDLQEQINLTGRLQPLEEIQVVAEVQGMALATGRFFNEGVRYAKGDLLVKLDNRQYLLDLQSSRSKFKAGLVQIMSAIELDYPAAFASWSSYLADFDPTAPIPNLPAVETQQLDYFLSANGIHTNYYAIKSAEEQLKKFKIYAPFSGVVTQSNLSAGAVVNPGVPLGRFSRNDVYELKLGVANAQLAQIEPGQTLNLTDRTTGRNWTGRVNRIGQTVDLSTQSVPVFLRVSGRGLREGLFLETALRGPNYEQVIRIPNTALTQDSQVHIITDGIVQLKAVDVLNYQGEEVLVTGLEVGDQVIVEQLDNPIVGQRATSK